MQRLSGANLLAGGYSLALRRCEPPTSQLVLGPHCAALSPCKETRGFQPARRLSQLNGALDRAVYERVHLRGYLLLVMMLRRCIHLLYIPSIRP